MIISPPFLLARNANETDEAWIDRCMPGGLPGDGAFPLSHAMQWHGGIHVREPEPDTPVRAIADGEVVYMRRPAAQPAGPLPEDHAQAYRGGWTDNGVIVLRHQTEIGEGANASVTFFSIYMHLHNIASAVQPNRRIYRKSPMGRAGQIYGEAGRLHFEIVCDDTNLQRLVGRASGDLSTSPSGRTDALYGEMHFHLPAGTPVYAERPMLNNPVAHRQPPRAAGQRGNTPLPAPVPLQAAHTTNEALFISLRYAGGEGAAANRGDAYVTTCVADGTVVGATLEENEAEYNLYTSATAISAAYPANARPAPSAVYELLRFGRVVGPDALTPADVPHWRRISHRGGNGWVNLNATGVTCLSDADFPHWKGWSLVDDSADQDSRCDSATVKRWLDVNGDGKVAPAEATARMGMASVAPKLAKAICKFPTEWNAATVDRRLGWLKTSTVENPTPIDAANFERLRAHVSALAFWPGGMGLPESHWHWSPKAFIEHFRRCRWLSIQEMVQLIPSGHPDNPRQLIANAEALSWLTTQGATRNNGARPAAIGFNLNKMMRRYGFSSAARVSHLFGQALAETDLLKTTREYGGADYFTRAYEDRCQTPVTRVVREWGANPSTLSPLGNCSPGDGVRYIGRGVIQMTGRSLYEAYGEYRGRSFVDGTAHLDVSDDASHACDSAGFYWVKEQLRDRTPQGRWVLRREVGIHRDADNIGFNSLSTVADSQIADADVLRVTRQINRAAFHIAWRRSFFKHCYYLISDLADQPPIDFRRRVI